ncbi:hypothetical protein CYPRO_0979 [Cyclonatronum proteinivorum]|uniref:PIN domain-containing protein n=1 Tax=Cyclonatronum proteinivorum TaxID=1457365 RepID=A0A345UIF4_9BACT|nr:type II toxin-antitoxin system VapC family toxin [Cyclonatronum proteinivorum]AXJ00256.1 hypothetical protein CYPRO_0979 [Cyclonatronum proteinivorum]
MNYLIDTCCISELIKPAPDEKVINWFNAQNENSLFLSVITFGELNKGIEKLPDSKRKSQLIKWIQFDLLLRFRNRIIGINLEVANEWGKVLASSEKVGRPLPAIDTLIAVSAIINGMTVVTRNIKDIEGTGAALINPWST